MSAELPKFDRNELDWFPASAGARTPFREVLGYDPFRRFFSNVDQQIDVIRTETGFQVEIPVAGYKTDQIELVVKENILTVTGKNERRAFTRSLKLPDDVDPQTIEASAEDGLLTLVLTRHPDAQPRRIAIKNASVSG